ncbi:FecR domain-containing protein [Duganella sp. sic0402]|uniref:FecR family protein n=1 Tax=Duganella sp. sic0402 TaxID=2854786 RepID=UPI001C490301|nr:FecR domain-containing protein [Duganella sp. sic0402]MBV7536857.1 FecR domain-containing protein [Duganella sp. sic0402]
MNLISLHEQAAQWFLRRSEPGWTGADERDLNAWLDASPQHRQIYGSMALTAHDLQQIPLAQDGAWRPQAAAAAQPLSAPAAPRWNRRTWLSSALAAGAVLAVGAGYGWQRWLDLPSYTIAVATAPGEIRVLDLPDGSSVTLNHTSKLTVRYSGRRRALTLDSGEAFFKVAHDETRPFTVDSGASQVKVLGTIFNLRTSAPQTVVKVLEGRVEVRPVLDAAHAQVHVLNPGSGLSIDTATGRARRLSAAAESVGDWRSGHLHFSSTPLSEVASELQRYLGQPVLIDDPALAAQAISGLAATSNPGVFLQALPAALPVQVRQLADGSWRISSTR